MAEIIFTESAAKQVARIKQKPDEVFRVSVVGGGCSGFSYKMELDQSINDGDQVVEVAGEKLVVDETSLPFLDGSTIDFVNELIGSSFKVVNPNATAACGCGVSFAV